MILILAFGIENLVAILADSLFRHFQIESIIKNIILVNFQIIEFVMMRYLRI
jgi:hypothetical protein